MPADGVLPISRNRELQVDRGRFCTTFLRPIVTMVPRMYVPAEGSSTASSSEPDPLTVLVVDDERSVVEGVSELLEGAGYGVATAMDGVEALEQLLRGLRPCLIVLDLMMPRMDGWDFRYEQMKLDDLKDIPVVVLTAAGFSEASVKAQFGAVDFLSKPFAPETLLHVIRQSCRQAT
jgi:CheY-like chemotaxis protein